jgi:hypothetical protein
MSSKSTLNAKNLEALGAERLAQLLIEISTGDAAAKRKLRLALAGAEGPKEAARAIVKRLTSIANAKSAIGWKQRKAFMEDLETQRRGIVEQVGKDDPQEALLLMWRFMSLANPVVLRCQGGDDSVMDVFHKACEDLGPLVMAARPGLDLLVDTVFDALSQNLFSQFDRLIAVLTPALGPEGLDQLRQRLEGVMRERSSDKEPEAGTERLTDVQYLRSVADRRTQRIVKRALLALADAQGDPDAFLAQIDMESRRICANAISIAERFLRANRPAEALEILDAADVDDDDWERMDWQDARIKVLDALNRPAEALSFRWACFERDLAADYLRGYLKKLPDFEDINAEDRAMAFVMAAPDLHAAIKFFIDWRSPARASELLLKRHHELDGNLFEYLTPTAEALAENFPLAATLALRAMIDFTLRHSKSRRYAHCARHLETCAALAAQIKSFGEFEPHEGYVARLKKDHGRKYGFWEA